MRFNEMRWEVEVEVRSSFEAVEGWWLVFW